MAAPKGNEFWKLRSKHGRDKLFATPEILWEAACEYFKWVEENPLFEEKGFAYQGIVTRQEFAKMRAMTMAQLCFFLHTNESYFRNFKLNIEGKEDPMSLEFSTVIHDIETIIRTQKFQGAAAELLNPNVIAQDLGLANKQEITFDKEPKIEIYVDSKKIDLSKD